MPEPEDEQSDLNFTKGETIKVVDVEVDEHESLRGGVK
jgi:hypothetical protein